MNGLSTLRRQTGASLCLSCGKCTAVCPLAAGGGFSAARLVAIHEPSEAPAAEGSAIQRCLTCAACEVRCPQGVRFASYVRGLRGELGAGSGGPCPHGAVLDAAARLTAGAERPHRPIDWLGDGLRVAEEGETGLFVGCLPLFDALFAEELAPRALDIARAAVRLLNEIGVEPVLVPDERCCGHDLLWRGEGETFRALAAANAEAFRSRGVKRILTTCAECCRTWRLDYPDAAPDYRPRVQHLAELLAAELEAGKLELQADGGEPLTYQDPCRLGRHVGVFDAPRRVLAEAGRVVEMERSGADALCCGTSGFIHCDADSRRLQSERLSSAADTGARTLVTACPKCLIHFRCAQEEDRRRGRTVADIEIRDLTVLTASRLARPSSPGADPARDRARRGEAA